MIEILHIAECPTWEETRDLVERLTGQRALVRLVASAEEAESIGFCGSPTVLVDGVDPWADQAAGVGLACRMYRLPGGRLAPGPDEEMVRASGVVGRASGDSSGGSVDTPAGSGQRLAVNG